MTFYPRLVRLKPYLNHRQFSAIAKPDSEVNKQKIRNALSLLETKNKSKTISSAEQILYLSLSDAVSNFPHSESSSDSIPSFLHELKNQPSLLCSLLEELKACPDLQKDRFYSHFITLYAEAGMFDSALQTFKDMDVDPSTQSLNILLRAAGLHNKNTGSEVLNLFNELSEDYEITTDIETYNILLEGFVPLGYYNHRDSICSLLEVMRDENIYSDEATSNIFMDGLHKEKLEDAAQVIVDMVEKHILLLVPRVYNFGVQSLCKLKKTSEALKLFNDLSGTRGILGDIDTYNSLLKEYVRLGYYEHRKTICSILETMENKDCDPDETTTVIFMDGLHMEKLEDAAQVIVDMVEEDILLLDARVYNFGVQSLCELKKTSEAQKLFNDLSRTAGMLEDVETYNSLLEEYVPLGYYNHMEIIFSILEQMEREDCDPDDATSNIFMDGLHKEKLEDAAKMIRAMVVRDILLLDSRVYHFGVESLCKLKKTSEALNLFEKVTLQKDMYLNADNFQRVIQLCCEEGKLVELIKFHRDMRDHIHTKTDRFCSERLVETALCKHEQYESAYYKAFKKASEALNLFEKVTLQKDMYLNADNFQRVIQLCREEGKLEELIKFHRDMRDHIHTKTDRFFCERLVETLYKHEEYETAYKAFKECISEVWFADAFLSDNRSTIKSLMCGLVRMSKHDIIKQLIELMEKNGLQGDLKFCNLGMECLSAVQAKVLFEGLKAKDDTSYMHLINAFSKEGNVEEVVELYHEMREKEKEKGTEPYRNSYETILKFLIRRGDTKNALKVCKHCMGMEWFQEFFFSSDEAMRKGLFSLITSSVKMQDTEVKEQALKC